MRSKNVRKQNNMFALVSKWEQSGQSQSEFCRSHKVSVPCLRYWLRHYRSISGQPAFVAVEVEELQGESQQFSELEIISQGGVCIRLNRRVSMEELACLVKSL